MTMIELDKFLKTNYLDYPKEFIHIATGLKAKIYGTGGGSTLANSNTKLIGYTLSNGDRSAIPCIDFIKQFRFFDNQQDGLRVSKAKNILSKR